MFYCLVFFLKHLYNTYTIVQNVDRYYIGVPYLEGIMDSACKQGSLSLSEVCGRHHMTSEKNSPKQTTPSICIRPDDDFGYTQNPTFCAGQHGKFFIAQPQKIFFCALISKQSIYSKDRPIKTCIHHVCTRQITIHFPFRAWQKHNLQNNRSELLMVI